MKCRPVILLVEDNPADIQILRRALTECALETDLVVVRDGEEAVDYLSRQEPQAPIPINPLPDLILLDFNLPRLTGLEVLGRIRANPALDQVPVVVLSTSSRPEEQRAVSLAGANAYIEKPRDFARFVDVLRSLYQEWLSDTAGY